MVNELIVSLILCTWFLLYLLNCLYLNPRIFLLLPFQSSTTSHQGWVSKWLRGPELLAEVTPSQNVKLFLIQFCNSSFSFFIYWTVQVNTASAHHLFVLLSPVVLLFSSLSASLLSSDMILLWKRFWPGGTCQDRWNLIPWWLYAYCIRKGLARVKNDVAIPRDASCFWEIFGFKVWSIGLFYHWWLLAAWLLLLMYFLWNILHTVLYYSIKLSLFQPKAVLMGLDFFSFLLLEFKWAAVLEVSQLSLSQSHNKETVLNHV